MVWVKDGWDMINDNGDEVDDMFGDIFEGFEYFSQIIDRAKGRTKLQWIFSLDVQNARPGLLSGYDFSIF